MDYKKLYANIISNAQKRVWTDGYVEKHHIKPKSLGGSDAKYNIVTLTAREHFLAHYCLWKFHTGYEKRKMAHAFGFMCKGATSNRYFSSKLYSALRGNVTHSAETKEKMSKSQTGRKHSSETKEKIRAKSSLFKHSLITKKTMSNKRIGKGNPMFGKKCPNPETLVYHNKKRGQHNKLNKANNFKGETHGL